jgi:leucyl aminopeptidase (aminopeptidase T)
MPRARPVRPAEALARAVLDRALRVRRGERLTIESWNHGLAWARALVVGAHVRGVPPTLVLRDEDAYFETLAGPGAGALVSALAAERREADAVVRLDGPEAFPRLLGLPTDELDRLLRATTRAVRPRAPRGRVLRLRVADVTPIAAERFGVDLDRWRDEVVRASLVDPAGLAAAGRRLSHLVRPRSQVRIRHPNGTDLGFSVSRRPARVDTGVPGPGDLAELPAGRWVVPVAPGSARGEFETNRATYDRFADDPVALRGRLEFGDGRLRGFEGDRASEAFAAFVRTGKGRVRLLALAIGLNPEVRRAPEILDLADGTVSLVVGDPRGRAAGRLPRFVFLASLAGADLAADDRPIVARGSFGGRRTSSVRRRVGSRARSPWSGRARGAGPRSARR